MLFIDIETSSPDPNNKELSLDPIRNNIDLIALFDDDHPFNVIVQSPEEGHFDFLGAMLGGHGFKFDFKTLHFKGHRLVVNQYAHDTLVMAVASIKKVPDDFIERYEIERRRLNADLKQRPDFVGHGYRPAQKHSLKILAPFFLGVSPFWENPDTHNDPEYAKKDVEYTKGLYDHFVPMLKRDGVWEFYEEKLMPWQRMTLEAELDGIHIDLEAMKELKTKAEAGVLTSLTKLREAWKKVEEEYEYKQRKAIEEEYAQKKQEAIAKLKPEKTEEKTAAKRTRTSIRYDELRNKALAKLEPFNYASPSQLLWAFKDVLRYPVTNMEGDETTGASVLELLAAQGKEDIKALLDYKANYKLAHSYFPSYEAMLVGGRLHCNFNLNGARTGRLSSDSPNLQQVPPGLKCLFTAAGGNVLVSQDLSAIEVVLIAYYTEDPTLCRIIIDGADFHGVCTVDFFQLDIDPAEVKTKCPDMRYAAKQGDLSIFYGSGKKRLFTTLTLNGVKAIKGKSLTERMCQDMVYRFRERFQGAWEFKQMLDAELIGGNYVENLFGRRFVIENPEDVYMKGMNRLIQGSASDLLLQGTLDCLKELKDAGVWARLRLLVHDNTVLECREGDAELVNATLCRHLTKFPLKTKHGLIPLKVEGGYGRYWKA